MMHALPLTLRAAIAVTVVGFMVAVMSFKLLESLAMTVQCTEHRTSSWSIQAARAVGDSATKSLQR